ncbi:MAG: helix-turn-helix transcriptional regulator [Bacteroidetes bacterium]|nr:helix-turn-helix transcriptional regulator [Bacteroidota bacterium]
MKKVFEVPSVHDYNAAFGIETLHPLVSVIDFSKATPPPSRGEVEHFSFGFYAVFLKQGQQCVMKYGRNTYDYQDGTLVFVAPGQVLTIERATVAGQPLGHGLLFHPDLILGTHLGRSIKEYAFFSYEVHEALHLSERERQIILDCFSKIGYELNRGIDKHSKPLITANIELLLGYCLRFYDRQFITRDHVNRGVLEKLESLLNDYFITDKPWTIGQPTVAYCAGELHLSANYFGDLIKKETGKSAQEFIQSKLLEVAKERIFDPTKSISEVAYELGFQYPQHFSRFFKQRVGCSPGEFRGLN